MPTFLPKDVNNLPIPALRMRDGGAHQVSAGASSARNTTPFDSDTRVISLYADVPVYIAFGGSDVTATASDHYFPPGLYYDVALGDETSGHHTHLAVLRVSADGTVYISEKE